MSIVRRNYWLPMSSPHKRQVISCRDSVVSLNTLRSTQNGRHFADDNFKCIFLNENLRALLKISLNFVPEVQVNNIPALIQIMAWRRSGNKPLSGTMMVSLLTHICVTRPQWVKTVNVCMTGIFLGMGSINERRRYIVTPSLIGWTSPRMIMTCHGFRWR